MVPSIRNVYEGQAGTFWNVLCCPLVCTVGLFWRSLTVYYFPCLSVLLFRLTTRIHQYICCCCGWPYEDNTFIGAAALGNHEGKGSAEQLENETIWLRAHELFASNGTAGNHNKPPQLFEGKIEPADLCQGAVGDCWLVAAMACASEHADSIRNMFVTREYNPRGLYKVRLFDPHKKRFVIVKVDDRIPCIKPKENKKKNSKTTTATKPKPRFMSPNGNELWAMILEKAFAKWCGSYAALDGGFVLWAWHAMTGDNVFQMSRKGPDHWTREDMVVIKEERNKRACGFTATKEKYTDENIWVLLKKYDRQKALISASIGKSDYGKFSGPNGEELLEGEGLVAGHAYSVIRAVEVTDSRKIGIGDIKLDTNILNNAARFRMVQLRNPWGTFEWKGDWSDKSKLWKKHPNVAKACGFVDADDGSFWMSFDDFIKFYTRVNICDRSTHNDFSLDVNEDRGCCGILCGCCGGCAAYWCLCKGVRNLYCGHRSTDQTLDTKEGCCGCCGV